MKRGLTLVEMLVALVATIILMVAFTQLFAVVSARITDAKTVIDLSNRMRAAANTLRNDLANHTCEMIPPRSPQSGDGYFEYIEGPLHDKTGENGFPATENFLGDTDDVLMLTVHAPQGKLFTGKYGGSNQVQSENAEVVWFMRPTLLIDPAGGTSSTNLTPPTFTLYRHTYLVLPTYQGQPTATNQTATAGVLLPLPAFYQSNDLSVHCDLGTGNFVPNTLGDLAKRECRFGHGFINNAAASNGFPHRVLPSYLLPFGGQLPSGNYSIDTTNARYGEDVVLTNVVSFDVQAYDPTAPVYSSNGVAAVSPADKGFNATPNSYQSNQETPPSPPSPQLYYYPQPDSLGAFVDLNWAGSSQPWSQIIFPVSVTLFNFDPCGTYTPAKPYPVQIGRIPLTVSANASGCIKEMSPFYSTGYPRSQLLSSGGTPTDFKIDWLNDTGVDVHGLPNYSQFGYAPATYDTWSTHYEHDGLDQDNDTVADQGLSGTPETVPPYPAPLRGIKVTIRCYDPDSRQFHQVSIVESFVPQ